MDANKTTTNWIIAGLVALVVIIGGGWLIARERSGTMATSTATSSELTGPSNSVTGTGNANTITTRPSSTPTPKPSPTPTPTSSAAGENVTVNDQPASSKVIVAEVNVNKPSFVAVRDTHGWYPGWQFVKSSQKDVVIPLKRSTVVGQTYEVVIFTDNGDGSFAIHGGDTLVTGVSGAPVSSTFKAQ